MEGSHIQLTVNLFGCDMYAKASRAIPFQNFIHLHQLHMILFHKMAICTEHLTSKQNVNTDSLISGNFASVGHILEVCCSEDVMIHDNNNSVHY